MATQDPISDFLTRIRNAIMAQHRFVDLCLSRMNLNIVKVLKEQGYIESYLVDEQKYKLRIFFKFNLKRESTLQGLKRVSSPGHKKYVGYQEIPRVLSGMGIAILSTPQGVIEGESARRLRVGGELLCLVW
jgi:small subunit ribosomal protein S8